MDRNDSFGNTWADQWDYSNPDPIPEKKESATNKYGKKVGNGFEKTKAVASTGMKKVKTGTTTGFQWIKDKYNKRTQKH
ncbi:uncharacterized protein LOC143851352 [Tasmannia lanceolata]|uniref:uncharacterized protein LOC143851352 n=1 Tax=Tasmannia lanceolata TaxID=3420 RepID=UPI004062CE23